MFEDISQKANINQDASWSSGVAMADLNNDGYLDIHVCKAGVGVLPQAKNLLYINQKDGTFHGNGLRNWDWISRATLHRYGFLDYDKDGDLDLYLLNHNVHSIRRVMEIYEKRENMDFISWGPLF